MKTHSPFFTKAFHLLLLSVLFCAPFLIGAKNLLKSSTDKANVGSPKGSPQASPKPVKKPKIYSWQVSMPLTEQKNAKAIQILNSLASNIYDKYPGFSKVPDYHITIFSARMAQSVYNQDLRK